MNMQVNTNGRIQPESALKADEVKQPEQAASAAGIASSAKAALEAQAGQVAGTAEAGKAAVCPDGSAAASARRPSCDQYIPQKAEETASYGHYQPVSDEEGNTRIQFDAPPQESAAGQDGESPASAEAAETAAGKQPAHDRYVPEKQSGQAKASAGKQNTQVLETQKKRLEQQVRTTGDSEERKALKKKLEQVKRALKAAGKK